MGKIKTSVEVQVSKETLIDLLKLKYSYKEIGNIVNMSKSMVQYACLQVYGIDVVKIKHYMVHENIDEVVSLYNEGWSLYRLADKYNSNDGYIKKVLISIGVPIRNISESLLVSEQCRGKNHYAWDETLSDDDRIGNRGLEYKEWAYKVKDTYGFKCDCCNKDSNGDMVAHHLHNYKDYPAIRFDIDNGVCLCSTCHNRFHKQYGKKFNTIKQYIEFKGEYNGN